MKITGAHLESLVYFLGLLAVQAHVLRHSIFDLSALEVYYSIVQGKHVLP